ncbi:MAG TPA: hypothetical protein VE971_02265 [Candidatus Eisenbacteria bacterium]|nr:hypothetical protein [Candidatus Eisenbacteria bacterium]
MPFKLRARPMYAVLDTVAYGSVSILSIDVCATFEGLKEGVYATSS